MFLWKRRTLCSRWNELFSGFQSWNPLCVEPPIPLQSCFITDFTPTTSVLRPEFRTGVVNGGYNELRK